MWCAVLGQCVADSYFYALGLLLSVKVVKIRYRRTALSYENIKWTNPDAFSF